MGLRSANSSRIKLLTAAIVDQARKHRKRSPDELHRVEEQRKAGLNTARDDKRGA